MKTTKQSTLTKLDNNQSGIASEFLVAGELCRRNFKVGLTLGNTKAIDLMVEKNEKALTIQIKGMQSPKTSANWRINKNKIDPNSNIFFVLVNLQSNNLQKNVEFFICTSKEVYELIIDKTKIGKETLHYLPYTKIITKRTEFENRWDKLEI
jgi:hypothetical protein